MVKLLSVGLVSVIRIRVRDRMSDLVFDRWLVMSVFRRLSGSGGAETELAEPMAGRR